ncbi:MAG TPA: L-threonylcarbamoyladenylate synthase [Pseudorhodoplanes sp.]|nr:L-threonylcarbamoyladenylate synthase [Pseudorhodoplanes sp.]
MAVELTTRVVRADPDAIAAAARTLREGGLVAFPTETVYGLGADATNGEAVARLYAAKGRPSFNPLISHVADEAAARALARFDATADRLARAFWPGPLTLVLPKGEACPVSDLATAGLDSIAVRVPSHPVAHDLIAATGRPVVAPSANVSGHVSPTSAAHVLADLDGRIDLIVDGGPTRVGVESTIVSCLGEPALLRPGGLSRERIEAVIGRPLASAGGTFREGGEAPLAPGMLSSHYAPRARLRLDATSAAPGEALLAFGPAPATAATTFNLSPGGDLVEAAANLFSHLRALDLAGATRVAVMPIPHEGLGEAINDRLRRAAAPRRDAPSWQT